LGFRGPHLDHLAKIFLDGRQGFRLLTKFAFAQTLSHG
jgi:hypothetical protein